MVSCLVNCEYFVEEEEPIFAGTFIINGDFLPTEKEVLAV